MSENNSENNGVNETNGSGKLTDQDEKVIAAMSKDALRSMFYMFAGKPDSKHKDFGEPVTISPNDLIDLNQWIREKFKLHNMSGAITTVSMSLDKNQTLDFGTWAEFETHDCRDPAAVKDLTIRWDFLIRLDAYNMPQRHTLTVNFSTELSPAKFLRVVVNAVDSLEDVDMSKMFGGCIARVDFISHVLADELLALVGKWHESLPKAPSSGTFLEKCKKHGKFLQSVIRHSFPIALTLLSYFVLQHFVKSYQLDATITIGVMRVFCLWILFTFVLMRISSQFGQFTGAQVHKAISRYGAHHTFNFTNGDAQRVKDLSKSNKKLATRFMISVGYSLLLNVAAGVIVVCLLK